MDPVPLIAIDCLLLIAARGDVVPQSGEIDSQWPGHASTVEKPAYRLNQCLENRSDPNVFFAAAARIFTVSFPLTGFDVDAVRIDLNSEAVPGFNEIDAVSINR